MTFLSLNWLQTGGLRNSLPESVLIAGQKSNFLGHRGVYFNAIFLCKDFRRKGLAKAAQRKFVKEFTRDNDFILGGAPIRFECLVSLTESDHL